MPRKVVSEPADGQDASQEEARREAHGAGSGVPISPHRLSRDRYRGEVEARSAVDLLALMKTHQLVAILRLPSYERAADVATALSAGGIHVIELTFTGAGVAAGIAAIRESLGNSVTVGAGTVLEPAQVDNAINAGAEFIVTPAVRPRVIARCAELGLPCMSGAFTSTEVAFLLDAGADLIKIFPARTGGPDHLRDLLGPYPNAHFVATGGITNTNARSYLDAGAVAVGIGNYVIPQTAILGNDWTVVELAARAAVNAISG